MLLLFYVYLNLRIKVSLNLFSQNNYSNLKTAKVLPTLPYKKTFFQVVSQFQGFAGSKRKKKYVGTFFINFAKKIIIFHKQVAC
jgi:hypothetical protein